MGRSPDDPGRDDVRSRWETMREQGSGASPEELCTDDPEFARRIESLEPGSRWSRRSLSARVRKRERVARRPRGPRLPAPPTTADSATTPRAALARCSSPTTSNCTATWRSRSSRRTRSHYPGLRLRFLREAAITGRLEHPGIVPVYGLGAHPTAGPTTPCGSSGARASRTAIDRFHRADGPGWPAAERGWGSASCWADS